MKSKPNRKQKVVRAFGIFCGGDLLFYATLDYNGVQTIGTSEMELRKTAKQLANSTDEIYKVLPITIHLPTPDKQ